MVRKPPECNLVCCKTPESAVEKIREDLSTWSAGEYAQRVKSGPTCSCNVRSSKVGCYTHPKFGPTDEPFSMGTE